MLCIETWSLGSLFAQAQRKCISNICYHTYYKLHTKNRFKLINSFWPIWHAWVGLLSNCGYITCRQLMFPQATSAGLRDWEMGLQEGNCYSCKTVIYGSLPAVLLHLQMHLQVLPLNQLPVFPAVIMHLAACWEEFLVLYI